MTPPDSPPVYRSPPTDRDHAARNGGWGKRTVEALPLLLVGGVGLVVTVGLYLSGTRAGLSGNGSVQPELWVLSLAVAITGLCAGAVVLFAGGSPAKTRTTRKVPRVASTRNRSKLVVPPPIDSPEESYPGPTQEETWAMAKAPREAEFSLADLETPVASPTLSRPFVPASPWDEDPTEIEEESTDSEETGEIDSALPPEDTIAESPSPDFVLSQIEEIESSLRRKARPPRSD